MTKNAEMKWDETRTCPSIHRVPPVTFRVQCGAVIGGWSSTRSNRVRIEFGIIHVRPLKLDKKRKVEDESFQQLPLLTNTHYPLNQQLQPKFHKCCVSKYGFMYIYICDVGMNK